ncbi:MAG: hypothetical protein ACLP9L_40265, partial [Thermoguttaceae bacterium]
VLPAPPWFIVVMKTIGFALHAVPMNLWYAGILVAMLLAVLGGEYGRRFSARLMRQMPVIIALGINFGIVPLLFIQVGYGTVFYPATILMAWPWLLVVVLLLPAYYGVYVCGYALTQPGGRPTRFPLIAGWGAAILFPIIGFIFANAMSLMENVAGWGRLYLDNNYHGAAIGTALNTGDPRLWPRWLLMFGLALTTTAAWVVVDGGWFAGRESLDYHRWARRFAWKLHLLGVALFAAAGSWYVFGTWPETTKEIMLKQPWIVLTAATALAPGATWLLLCLAAGQEGRIGRPLAALAGLAQFGVVLLNAVSRQVVQHLELRAMYDIFEKPARVQWAPLAIFLAVAVLGLGVVAWLIYHVARLPVRTDAT